MNKKEKYLENLSKYHVPKELIEAKLKESKKQEIKKFEFRDVKTVEALIGEVKKDIEKVKSNQSKVKEEYKSTVALGNKLEKLEEEQMKLGNTWEKAYDKWTAANNNLEKSLGDMKDMELETAKENLIKSAQNIGVGVPPVAKKAAGVISAAIKVADDGYNTSNKVPAR